METERDVTRSRLIREADFHDKRIHQHISDGGEERQAQRGNSTLKLRTVHR